jgi:xanthine dehydrogenase/oxidase
MRRSSAGAATGARGALRRGFSATNSSSSSSSSSNRQDLRFYLNGRPAAVRAHDVRSESLLTWLRQGRPGLTGAKHVCGEGGCGACTVLVSRWRPSSGEGNSHNKNNNKNNPGGSSGGTVEHSSVASCLTPLPFVDGTSVWTVEGLRLASVAAAEADAAAEASEGQDQEHGFHVGPIHVSKDHHRRLLPLHPVQEALVRSHATQCGYCTPGFAMSFAARLAQQQGDSTCSDLERALDGNLCRCTGYRPIVDAGKLVASDEHPELSSEQKTLRHRLRGEIDALKASNPGGEMFPFPEELAGPDRGATQSFTLTDGNGTRWCRPGSLQELLELKAAGPSTTVGGAHSHPDEGASYPMLAKVVSGFTDVGYKPVRASAARAQPRAGKPVFVSTSSVEELRQVEWEDNGVWFGGGTTINQFAAQAQHGPGDRQLSDYQKRALDAAFHQTRFFANNQVRDMGTIAGSLVNCSQVSDLVPAMIAMDATVELVSLNAEHEMQTRRLPASEFVLGDRSVDLRDDEILRRVFIPHTGPQDYVMAFKQGHKRKLDSMSVLNSSMRIELSEDGSSLKRAVLAFGGLGKAGIRAIVLESWLQGRPWSRETFDNSLDVLRAEIPELLADSLHPDVSDKNYQGSLILGNWLKMWAHVDYLRGGERTCPLRAEDIMLTTKDSSRFDRELVHVGWQDYAFAPTPLKHSDDIVSSGKVYDASIHVNALEQTTGEATYTADYGLPPSGFHAALVTSQRANAKIDAINAQPILDQIRRRNPSAEVHFFDANDVPGSNYLEGFRPNDAEPVFATDRVQYYGQPIGIAVSQNYDLARNAARLISSNVEYSDERDAVSGPIAADELPGNNWFETSPVYTTSSTEDAESGLDVNRTVSRTRVLKRGDADGVLDSLSKRAGSDCGVTRGTVQLRNGQVSLFLLGPLWGVLLYIDLGEF